MFVDEIIKEYGVNTPIWAEEIIELYNNYTRAYVFRLIRKAEEEGKLVSFSRGVYYIPKKTFFGKSTICSEMVAEKKYLRNNQLVYGIYSGLNLLNQFGITTQVPNTMDIVTNKEKTRKRKVTIEGRDFILRKSRCEITQENYSVYTILQLFSDMNTIDKIDELVRMQISEYIKKNKITVKNLFLMSKLFPSATLKKMIGSGVLNGIV